MNNTYDNQVVANQRDIDAFVGPEILSEAGWRDGDSKLRKHTAPTCGPLTLEVWLSSTLRPTKAANCSHDHLHVYAYDLRIIRHVEIEKGVARVVCTRRYSCHVPESVTGVRVSVGVRCILLEHR